MEIMRCVKSIRCPIWLHSMLSNANPISQSLDLTWQRGCEEKPGDGFFCVPKIFVWNACKNVECSTGVIFLDPCPNKLINCESINADLDLIYHQIYSRECVFSFSKERQNLRLDECLKEKWRRSKVSYIQREIFRQTQFPIWGCLFRQTTDGVQHRDLLKPFSILLPSRSKHCCLL